MPTRTMQPAVDAPFGVAALLTCGPWIPTACGRRPASRSGRLWVRRCHYQRDRPRGTRAGAPSAKTGRVLSSLRLPWVQHQINPILLWAHVGRGRRVHAGPAGGVDKDSGVFVVGTVRGTAGLRRTHV